MKVKKILICLSQNLGPWPPPPYFFPWENFYSSLDPSLNATATTPSKAARASYFLSYSPMCLIHDACLTVKYLCQCSLLCLLPISGWEVLYYRSIAALLCPTCIVDFIVEWTNKCLALSFSITDDLLIPLTQISIIHIRFPCDYSRMKLLSSMETDFPLILVNDVGPISQIRNFCILPPSSHPVLLISNECNLFSHWNAYWPTFVLFYSVPYRAHLGLFKESLARFFLPLLNLWTLYSVLLPKNSFLKMKTNLGVVVHACNPSIPESGNQRINTWGESHLHSKSEVNPSYMRTLSEKQKQPTNQKQTNKNKTSLRPTDQWVEDHQKTVIYIIIHNGSTIIVMK